MREHYADYFTRPNVMAVLGVSFWEDTRLAAAILWTRQAAGSQTIVVSQAVDFGVAPLTDDPDAGAHFDDPTVQGLPAVPPGMWLRFVMDFTISHAISLHEWSDGIALCRSLPLIGFQPMDL